MADYTLSAKITGDSKGFGKAVSTAESTLSNFESKIGNISSKFKSVGDAVSSLGDKLTSKITTPALGAATALGSITLVKGWNRLTGIDDAKAKLKALGNTAEETENIMNSALESVRGTSYGMDEAVTTAAGAVAAGVKQGQELTDYLSMTADAAAIAGSSMADMGSIMNKVQTSQVAYTDNLNQLADRGIPIYQWIADEAGVTASAVKDMASNGEISSQMFFNAIQKNIGGAAKAMGENSIKSTIANIGATISRIGANFLDAGGEGGGFFSTIKPMLTDFNNKLGELESKAAELGVKFGNAFNKIVSTAKTMMAAFQKGGGGLKGLSNAFSALDSTAKKGELPSIFSSIAKGAKTVADVLSRLQNGGVSLGKLAAGAIAAGPALKIAGKATSGFGSAISVLSKVTGSVGGVLSGVSGTISSVFNSIGGKISPLIGKLGGFASKITSVFSKVIGFVNNFGTQFTSILTKAFSFGAIGGLVLVGLGLIQQNFGDKISEILTMVQEKGPELITQFCTGIASKIPDLITQGGELVSNLLQTITALAPSLISGGADIIVNLVNGFASQLPTLLSKAGELIITIIKGLTAKLPAILSSGMNIISSLVEGIASFLPDLIPAAIDMIVTLAKGLIENIPALIDCGGKLIGAILDGFMGGSSQVGKSCMPLIEEMGSNLKDFGKKIMPVISGAIKKIAPVILNLLNTIVPMLLEVASSILPVILDAASAIITVVAEIASAILPAIGELISTIAPVIVDLFNQIMPLISKLIQLITPFIQTLVQTLMPIISKIIVFVGQLIEALMPLFDSIFSAIEKILDPLMELVNELMPPICEIIQAIMDLVSALMPVVIEVIDSIISAISPIVEIIGTIVGTIIDIIRPIITFIANVIAKIVEYITPIIEFIATVLGKIYSTAFNIIGKVYTFIQGVVEKISNVIKTIRDVFDKIFGTIYRNIVKPIMEKVGGFITGIFDGVKKAWNGLSDFVGGVFDGISEAINTVVDGIKGFVNKVIDGINFAIDIINAIPGVDIGPIDYLLHGTDDWQGGFARMNEGGRGELTYLPNGTQVIPHDISVKYAKEAARSNSYSGSSYDDTFNAVYSAMRAASAASGGDGDIYVPVSVYYDSQLAEEKEYKYKMRQLVRSNGKRY